MKVNKEEKLIDYLKQFKNYKTLLKNGSVLVNDKIITRYDYMLKVNDEVTINKYNKSKDIKIIYEDKDIIVVDKPYNLLTISNGREISLYNLVSEYVKKNNILCIKNTIKSHRKRHKIQRRQKTNNNKYIRIQYV